MDRHLSGCRSLINRCPPRAPRAVRQAGDASRCWRTDAQSTAGDIVPLIDPTVFAHLRELADDDLLRALIDAFLEEAPALVAAMQQALVTQDVDVFRRSAHTLKSNAATFGAASLEAMARELEAMGRAADLNVGARLDAVHESCRAVCEELGAMKP
jgi:HPt (histidine-containing phosphotransfer) domain-containing protein